MRIHEAAKKYKTTNENLIELLKKGKFAVKSHMSSMTEEMVAYVESRLPPKQSVKTKAPKPATPTAKTPAQKRKVKAKATPKAPAKSAAKPKAAPKAKPASKVTPSRAKPATKSATRPAAKPATRPAAKPATKPAAKPVTKPVTKPATPPARPTRRPAEAARKDSPKASSATRKPTEAPRREPSKPPRRKPSASEAQQKAVRESVRRTLAKIEATRRTRRRKEKPKPAPSVAEKPVGVAEDATVSEIANALNVDAAEVVERLGDLGAEATANQRLDRETIELLAEDVGKPVQFVADEIDQLVQAEVRVDASRSTPRAPIVTVMGHVDHGKTSILDHIRKTRVASGEAGGITQHIGAYEVESSYGKITFIDTPGHEAFTAMRARGAQVTDIVILVVAADDGVMPQTIEAIDHAKAAGVPIIVAINKIDLPAAKPVQIKQQLSERGVVVEEFGGEVVAVEVSAKTGDGIDRLLEMVSLQAELMELKADREASAQAVAIEIRKEEGRGILCTVLVTQGTLKIGDAFVVGAHYGKVRALLDHQGRPVKAAAPATPVLVLGANGLPEPGDVFTVVRSEKEAREASERRQQQLKDRELRTSKKMTLEELYSQIQQGEVKELRLVVKGDTNGSVEALTDSLTRLSNDEVAVKVIHAGVGVAGESDVLLASSSDAVLVAFGIKVSPKAAELADRERVEIKSYSVIYEAIEQVGDAMKGLLEPERVERILGRAEVRKVFKISRTGPIAGSFVTEGSILRNASARVVRADDVIYEGKISSLKRFQDDVREVQTNFECGIGVSGFTDLQEGDVIEAFVVEEKARAI